MTGMWLAAGSWQCISEEFKEINSLGLWSRWRKNTPISRKSSLMISSYARKEQPERKCIFHFLLSTSCVFFFWALHMSRGALNCLCSQANWRSQSVKQCTFGSVVAPVRCLSQLRGEEIWATKQSSNLTDICHYNSIPATLNSIFLLM